MKKWSGYEETQVIKPQEKLPVGNYILKIMDAEEIQLSNGGTALKISFDIDEGEHKGFYAENYRSQPGEDKRWKGHFVAYAPREDGSEMDQWTKSKFKSVTSAIEESNPGYHWDWDEKNLKGKRVGGVFFEKEYEINGRTGMYTACHSLRSIEDVKAGNIKTPKPKLLKNHNSTPPVSNPPASDAFDDFEELGNVDDKDLPF